MKVVSPIGAGARTRFRPPRPLDRLNSRPVGILSNGKVNAGPLLHEVAELLVRRHGMARSASLSLTERADGPGFPAPAWMVETLTSGSALALVGVGD